MRNDELKELTKAEDEIMQILWKIEKGFVKEIIENLPEPKPAYNTVSTIVRILEKKGFVHYNAYGKTHQYFPVVSKGEYSDFYLKKFIRNYFKGSFKDMVSFFTKKNDMNINEIDKLLSTLDDLKEDNKNE